MLLKIFLLLRNQLTTASSLLDNSDIKKQTEETADAITRTADQVIDAKSKEADAVVAANDKIAESEKKVTNQVTDAAKEQNDTIKTVFGLKNVNSNLTRNPCYSSRIRWFKTAFSKGIWRRSEIY